jgi:septation ring formation regulator EzrA
MFQDGNQDGFGYPRSAYADYVKYMAKVAHDNDMAIGLKNAVDMIPDVLSDVQFAVNEECRELNECDAYKSMTKAGLAVFNIEYATTDCSDPSGVNLSTVLKTYDLDTIGGQC